MTAVDRVARVRSAYEKFNNQDVEGLLAIMTDDVEWPDIRDASEMQGKDALRHYLNDVLATATPRATLGDLFQLGDVVVAMSYHQAYGDDGKLLGPPRSVSERFSFRGDLISRVELTSPDDIADSVRMILPHADRPGGSPNP